MDDIWVPSPVSFRLMDDADVLVSSTTGLPKAAEVSYCNVVASSLQTELVMSLDARLHTK